MYQGKVEVLKSRLASSIGDAAWEPLRQLAYKAKCMGGPYWQSPHKFASGKTCNDCGVKLMAMPLSTRSRSWLDYVNTHDRDKNAARNILAAGFQATSTAGRGPVERVVP